MVCFSETSLSAGVMTVVLFCKNMSVWRVVCCNDVDDFAPVVACGSLHGGCRRASELRSDGAR